MEYAGMNGRFALPILRSWRNRGQIFYPAKLGLALRWCVILYDLPRMEKTSLTRFAWISMVRRS